MTRRLLYVYTKSEIFGQITKYFAKTKRIHSINQYMNIFEEKFDYIVLKNASNYGYTSVESAVIYLKISISITRCFENIRFFKYLESQISGFVPDAACACACYMGSFCCIYIES